MPVITVEKWNSRSMTIDSDLTSSKITGRFVCLGTRDDAIARQSIEETLPRIYTDWPTGAYLWLLRYSADFVGFGDGGQGEPGDTGCWDVTAEYGTTPPRKPEVTGPNGETYDGSGTPDDNGLVPSFTFDTTGGTAHIEWSRATRGIYVPAGKPTPDFRGLIGLDGRGVQGVDIVSPQFNFTETRHFAAEAMTPAYVRNLFHLTSKVNQQTFRGFPAGEVLFMGASGSRRGLANWELVFRFACSPNADNLTVANGITVTEKRGHDYMWMFMRHEEVEDFLIPVAQAAVVEKVYQEGNFGLLNIGTH